ncbi:DUF1232 domain-containing protein [Glaciihabitans tibetensis]|nr:YkvA family protein [Glaciihabitans tibetensis]
MSSRRKTVAAVLVAVAAVVYGASPIDIIPELLTGPLGLTDDFAVVLGAGFTVWKLLSGRPRVSQKSAPPAV